MEKLKHKLKDRGGFTLVEMLVVVAIIAILVAVSIPLIGNALERTKHATDAANERAAKAEILLQYLTDDANVKIIPGDTYFYDAKAGKIVESSDNIVGYGKHDRTEADHKDKILAVRISKEDTKKDEVEMVWVAEKTERTATIPDWNQKLCAGVKKVDHSE